VLLPDELAAGLLPEDPDDDPEEEDPPDPDDDPEEDPDDESEDFPELLDDDVSDCFLSPDLLEPSPVFDDDVEPPPARESVR